MRSEAMDAISPELSLDLAPTFVPKTISDFLREVSMIGGGSEKIARVAAFVKGLEEEMKKIDAFKRELPLCMLLLNDAIRVLKEEAARCTAINSRPVLEEFIPMKKQKSDEEEREEGDSTVATKRENDFRDKKNWMSSVQLWNADEFPSTPVNQRFFDPKCNHKLETEKNYEERTYASEDSPFQNSKNKSGPRAFLPFKGYSTFPVRNKEEKDEASVQGLSLLTPGMKNPKEESGSGFGSVSSSRTSGGRANSSSALSSQTNFQSGPQPPQHQTSRKQRRCWSPDLHRRFVNALQQLGGSQVATPKQIRELMQVEGLTNDEVKSHLQKYRLHTRRLQAPGSNQGPSNPSVMVLGSGLWGSHDQYGESSKGSSSQSGSPQGPFQLAAGTSMTGGESLEDDEDAKSESYTWKGHAQKPEKDDA